MAISMTGFGVGEFKDDKYSISVECKTINHKYLDINPRLPRKISFLEDKLRLLIKDNLRRGRIDIFIKLENISSSNTSLDYDAVLAKQYFDILSKMREDFGIEKPIELSDIYKFPDVIKATESEEDEDVLWNVLSSATKLCLNKLTDMRVIEGKKLEEDILSRTQTLEEVICKIEKLSETVEEEYRIKLNNRISELLDDPSILDENRLAQEVAIYADKSSIVEEIVRFKSHIIQLRDTVVKEDAIGRKLDFIIQEMNRETNTIGSKVSNIEITNYVIEIKSELEKIREQVQNIE